MKRKTHFQFKQFSIRDDRCTMKVGTDGVLLAAWSAFDDAQFILDVGTGSGIMALIAAQRSASTALIDAVEILADDAKQAAENVRESPWSSKIVIHHTPIQKYESPYQYDVIICNPPYFINSLQPADTGRKYARHTITLDQDILLQHTSRLIKKNGCFNTVYPLKEGELFIQHAIKYGFFCTRNFSFRTREGKPIERLLLEFSQVEGSTERGEILLYDHDTEWSTLYHRLISDLYLKA